MPTYPQLPLAPGDARKRPKKGSAEEQARLFLKDIQGGILAAAGRGEFGALLFFSFKDPDAHSKNAATVRKAADIVTTAWQQYQVAQARQRARAAQAAAAVGESEGQNYVHRPFRSLALTGPGLEACGIRQRERGRDPGDGRFPSDMNSHLLNGMYRTLVDAEKAAAKLAETSAIPQPPPETPDWTSPYKENTFSGIWVLAHRSPTAVKRLVTAMKGWCERNGCSPQHVELGLTWRPFADKVAREPFGFADGISMPTFFDYERRQLADGSETPDKGAADMTLDELFLPPERHFGGSLLVFKKLEQNVAAFKRGATETEMVQRIGRDRSGVPLIADPVRSDILAGTRFNNDFSFATDRNIPPVCPFHAHIRRANPRGYQTAGGGRALIARRSWVFGSEEELAKPDGASGNVGLLFLAYMQDFNRFLTITRSWMWEPDFPVNAPGAQPGDPLLFGKNSADRFVVPKGGEWAYVPSMTWLRTVNKPALADRRR